MTTNCCHSPSHGGLQLPLPQRIRPSTTSTNRDLTKAKDSDDEILSDLSKLFDALDLDWETECTSAKDDATNELPEDASKSMPKCKAYDIPLELAGAAYFIVDRFIYAWNHIDWSISSMNESCEPSDPFYVAAPNQDILIMDAIFRVDENGTIFRWLGGDQWNTEPLYGVYGDAYVSLQKCAGVGGCFPLLSEESTFSPTYLAETEPSYTFGEALTTHTVISEPATLGPIQSKELGIFSNDSKNTKDMYSESSGAALLGSLMGFPNLIASPSPIIDDVFSINDVNGIDLSTPFLGEGTPPTFDNIARWVESQKGTRRTPGSSWVCPLKGCERLLRRPHALKDHLLFHFDIKGVPFFQSFRVAILDVTAHLPLNATAIDIGRTANMSSNAR
ncbi:hypothetical protein RhiXN_05292 [Rhizoctonia solani]|uniref:C2H2-type domain-containing protein n=1 Tax=Rhizoctonia solani TaxID=456999 RepID=A0A8H8NPY1_9AGAM|nr:uncharacterized protein RhiXN_05292 [Rhizoctonia solani]QRW17290.1 hypothetical protein RhiXN_05292 [Rhizoctonia solani]